MTDLIDTTEMYLRTISELDEEGIDPLRARIAERLGHEDLTVPELHGAVIPAGDSQLGLQRRGCAQVHGRCATVQSPVDELGQVAARPAGVSRPGRAAEPGGDDEGLAHGKTLAAGAERGARRAMVLRLINERLGV